MTTDELISRFIQFNSSKGEVTRTRSHDKLEDDVFSYYGTPLAKIARVHGKVIVVVNVRTYSVSTTRRQNKIIEEAVHALHVDHTLVTATTKFDKELDSLYGKTVQS